MKTILKPLFCVLLLAIVLFSAVAFAAEDPIVAEIEISPNTLTEAGQVNVSITISNSGEEDLKDPVYLYTPQGKLVTDFGTDGAAMLKAGESKTWSGTYDVNTHTLEDGKIVYYVKYTLYDSDGKAQVEKQPLSATITKGKKEVSLSVDRVITPTVAREGQVVTIKYTIANDGESSLYNVTIQENKAIKEEKQTIQELKPGKSAEITYTVTMGTKNLKSAATITYAATEGGKSKTYKVEEQVITYGEPSLSVSLTSSAKGVTANSTVTLKLTLKNTGTVGYSDIRVSDETLGEIFSGESVAAGKTLTLEKEITVPETTDYVFTIKAVDETGSDFSVETDPLTVTAIDPAEALNLTVNVTADRTEVYEESGKVHFTITITNTSNMDAKNLVLSHGSVTITTISELKAGKTKTINRDVAVTHSGRYRFTVKAVDPLDNTFTFTGNDIQVVISVPTAVPATATPKPAPTAAPTAPVYTVPSVSDPSIAPAMKGINATVKVVMIIAIVFFVLSLGVLVSAGISRGLKQKASNDALDQLEVSEHRDYSQPAQEKEDTEPAQAEVTLPMEEDVAAEQEPTVKYARKASFGSASRSETEDLEPSIDESAKDFSGNAESMPDTGSAKDEHGGFDVEAFFKPEHAYRAMRSSSAEAKKDEPAVELYRRPMEDSEERVTDTQEATEGTDEVTESAEETAESTPDVHRRHRRKV